MNSIFTLTVEKSKLTLPTANEKQGMLTGVPLPPPTHCAAVSCCMLGSTSLHLHLLVHAEGREHHVSFTNTRQVLGLHLAV